MASTYNRRLGILVFWYIWKMRNDYLFTYHPMKPLSVKIKIFHGLYEWNISNFLPTSAASLGLPPDIWLPPPGNYVKLNFDGSYNPFTKFAGIGGIIRSPAGTVLAAYAGKVSAEDPIGVELSALLKVVQLCIELGLKQVIVEGDCLILLDLVNNMGR